MKFKRLAVVQVYVAASRAMVVSFGTSGQVGAKRVIHFGERP
jgi:hypothetical protein